MISRLTLLLALLPAAGLAQPHQGLTFTLAAEHPFAVPSGPWTGRTAAFAEPGLEKVAGKTIPTFTRTIVA
ncbi:MAG TPA: hypothetical protein VGQ28_03830, partial [Thermoanaerobaculia bacterium]|nr:hypothetical protein [Thermoanaerobaculia bacterium]